MLPLFSGGNETGGVGKGDLSALDIAQCFANHLFGDACTFAALAGNAGGFAHLSIAATAFVDGFTDLTISNTLAKTHVHMNYPLGLR